MICPTKDGETRENGCIFTECVAKLPCKRKVVPKNREEGYCAWMVTETKRNAIEQEEKKTLYVCAKCLRSGDVIKSHTILSRGSCDRCHKTRSCYTIQ